MSDELIERVATALEPKCRAFGRGDMPMQVAREFARAAIEAMREPTIEMVFAAPPGDAGEVWEAMIDAALSPNTGVGGE